jgi:outer membrane protein OmpA-like peptidoglycan-associated protein
MLVRITASLLALGVLAAACGGPSERHCGGESAWDGTCVLRGVNKLRQAEFPVPHVVIEALYEPQQSPSSPNFTPPAIRQEFKVMASQELELRAWLEKNASASCHMDAPPPGSCDPGQMRVDVPTFAATGQTPANEVHGCAQIESQATQDKLSELGKNASPMPEVMNFGENSAEATPEVQQAVTAVAQRIKSNPGIECVAVVGQISPGEPAALAGARASTVRHLLETAGVEPSRLLSITITEQVYGMGASGPVADPTKRRATLRVLLQR